MIIIDPGHGGSDNGGGSNQYFLEKDLNLKISLYQYNRLKELGIKVDLTRYTDIDLYSEARIQRIKSIPKTGKNDLLISNHVNVDYGNLDGAEVIYSIFNNDKFPKIVAKNLALVGQNLSPNGIYTRRNSNNLDYYYIIRESNGYEAILIEYGFADSPDDDVNLLLYKWEELAEAIVKSICEYYNYSYDRPKTEKYLVKPGDSLYKIALIYNTTVDKLKELNNITNDLIKVGQYLTVPTKYESVDTILYKVKKGDSLYKISNLFNVSIDNIKKANNLVNNTIYIKQELNIPLGKKLYEYTVLAGDTLFKIANKNNVTVDYIKTINNLASDTIYVNQKLLI